jgi:hypothetical protein
LPALRNGRRRGAEEHREGDRGDCLAEHLRLLSCEFGGPAHSALPPTSNI